MKIRFFARSEAKLPVLHVAEAARKDRGKMSRKYKNSSALFIESGNFV